MEARFLDVLELMLVPRKAFQAAFLFLIWIPDGRLAIASSEEVRSRCSRDRAWLA